ncbi:MAG: hypothetical protein IJX90_00135 [Blautia sp.]|nr:hypothetical protein [Blautia sp.]
MNCINCGSRLSKTDREYCPHCGFNIKVQRKVDYLSKYYYNQGLEKATIRDLSGAISCLKQSLTYNKNNIDARNLLGLVYFETGEVVAALSEWVISKNLQSSHNLASDYIARLQANSNKLEAINETIRKYNHALELCREGHEDMAAIQLKRILTQNSKLIKGYHLLALIHMKNHEWNRARRILKKAARIDKTNTTTLRFLKEVDEQTGVTTKLEKDSRRGLFGGNEKPVEEPLDSEASVPVNVYRERSRISLFVILVAGLAAGALAFWLLAVPAIRQKIYREANQQITKYSESLASQGVELSRAQSAAQESGDSAEEITKLVEEEKRKSQSYEHLLNATMYLQQYDLDDAALEVQQVYVSTLTETMMPVYNNIVNQTGVYGIEDGSAVNGSAMEQSGSESGYYEESYDEDYSEEYYDEEYYDEEYYDEGY